VGTLSNRLESLEREGSEGSAFGEMPPHTRALLDALRDPSRPMPCASQAPSAAPVKLPPHTQRFLDEMRVASSTV